MTGKISLDWHEAPPRWILWGMGAYLVLDLFVICLWNLAGPSLTIRISTESNSALPITAMGAIEFWCCLIVLRALGPASPMRLAWGLITCAAAARTLSGVVAQVLGTNWLLNPLVWSGHSDPAFIERIRQCALLAGGPLRLALLAAAMLAALRILRRFGFWTRPAAADWAIAGIVCLFTLCRFVDAGAASFAGKSIPVEDWISLAGHPILCVLFLEAMLLRQAVTRMGNGLVTRCWTAFMCGIFLTGLGELALWIIPRYSQAWPLAIVESITRFPTAAVFALAPAYQVVAQYRAMKPAAPATTEIAPNAVPRLAP